MTVDEAKIALGLDHDSQLADFFKLRPQAIAHYHKIGRLPDGRAAIIKLHLLEKQQAQQAGAAQG